MIVQGRPSGRRSPAPTRTPERPASGAAAAAGRASSTSAEEPTSISPAARAAAGAWSASRRRTAGAGTASTTASASIGGASSPSSARQPVAVRARAVTVRPRRSSARAASARVAGRSARPPRSVPKTGIGGAPSIGRRGQARARGGEQRARVGVERGGQRRHRRAHAERVGAPGVDAAEQRVDETVGHLVPEPGPHQLADGDVAARLPRRRDGRRAARRARRATARPPAASGSPGTPMTVRGGSPTVRPPTRSADAAEPGCTSWSSRPELGDPRRRLGTTRQEGLGARVDTTAADLQGRELAAERARGLDDDDVRLGTQEGAQAVRRGQARDPAADDEDAVSTVSRAPGRRPARARPDRSRGARRGRG